ncbi:MAG: hypothetical protein AAFQ82_17795, partial [Myxococcota bacterium]
IPHMESQTLQAIEGEFRAFMNDAAAIAEAVEARLNDGGIDSSEQEVFKRLWDRREKGSAAVGLRWELQDTHEKNRAELDSDDQRTARVQAALTTINEAIGEIRDGVTTEMFTQTNRKYREGDLMNVGKTVGEMRSVVLEQVDSKMKAAKDALRHDATEAANSLIEAYFSAEFEGGKLADLLPPAEPSDKTPVDRLRRAGPLEDDTRHDGKTPLGRIVDGLDAAYKLIDQIDTSIGETVTVHRPLMKAVDITDRKAAATRLRYHDQAVVGALTPHAESISGPAVQVVKPEVKKWEKKTDEQGEPPKQWWKRMFYRAPQVKIRETPVFEDDHEALARVGIRTGPKAELAGHEAQRDWHVQTIQEDLGRMEAALKEVTSSDSVSNYQLTILGAIQEAMLSDHAIDDLGILVASCVEKLWPGEVEPGRLREQQMRSALNDLKRFGVANGTAAQVRSSQA